MRVEEGADRGIALRHPGALVEQVRGGVEIGEGQFDQPVALGGKGQKRVLIGGLHRGIAEELAVGRGRHADRQHGRQRAVAGGRHRPRIGVRFVGLRRHLEHAPGVVDGQREDGDAVERAAGGDDA